MKIIARQEHVCLGLGRPIGDTVYRFVPFGSKLGSLPEGTVVECEQCGTTWVAERLPETGWMAPFYRPETKREKKKRLNRSADQN